MNVPKMFSISTSCRALYRQKLHWWTVNKSVFGLSLEDMKKKKLISPYLFLINLVINCNEIKGNLCDNENA